MKQNLIAQVAYKSRDKSFKPSYSMIVQYLSNKNKNNIISESKNFLDLNKDLTRSSRQMSELMQHTYVPCLLHTK